jgi:hypothetical protein
MKILALRRYFVLMMCIVFSFGSTMASGKEGGYFEKYHYEALPVAGEEGKKETVEMELLHTERNITYHAKISSLISREEIKIEMDRRGQFISGTRQVSSLDQGLQAEEKIWHEKDKVFMQGKGGGKERQKAFDLADRGKVAVDGSLLLLLRFFPFERGETWKVFMVDFTGYAITVEAHLTGTEMITTPAGTFECYRMEVIVEIPVLHPRIIYWLAKDAPHYLVKSVGKSGPFTDTYVTTLISRE